MADADGEQGAGETPGAVGEAPEAEEWVPSKFQLTVKNMEDPR